MSDYDAAFAIASQGLAAATPPKNEYDAIMSGILPQVEKTVEPAQKSKSGSGSELIDAGNAVGTGYFKGLASLAGLPVDTVTNVLDLGKAALGAPYTAITGKTAPDWLSPADRKNIVGTGAYILDRAGNTALGKNLTQAANPEFEGGYLQAAGGALNGVVRPQTVLQGVNQAVNSVAGVTAGKAIGDATGNPALATDNGTGDYTVNFTTAMPDADYAVNVSASSNAAAVANPVGANFRTGAGVLSPPGTTSTRFTLCAAGTAYDCDYVFVSVVR